MKEYFNSENRLEGRLLEKIVIVRSLPGLGDFLCLVPALRALRVALPEAQITLIGMPWTKSFVKRFSHYIDQWLEFPGYPGIPEVPLSPHKTVAFLTNIQPLNVDLVLQMHGNGSCMNSFVALCGAKQSAGFFPAGHYCPDADYFMPYPDREPEIWRHLRLLEFLGIPLQGSQLEFPISNQDWREFSAIAATHNLFHDYICIHPGASTRDRRWSEEGFAKVADALTTQGLQIVLTGTAAEATLTNAVAQTMHFPAVDLAGATSLGGMAALLKKSRLLICNDTGVSHLAAALQVNSVVIFSNSDPRRWAPLDRQRHRIVQAVPDSPSVGGDARSSHPVAQTAAVSTSVLAEAADLLQMDRLPMDCLESEFAYAS